MCGIDCVGCEGFSQKLSNVSANSFRRKPKYQYLFQRSDAQFASFGNVLEDI